MPAKPCLKALWLPGGPGETVNSRSASQLLRIDETNEFTCKRSDARDLRQGKGTKLKSRDYFLPDFFFAAQYAFNFADNLARVAVLITVFLAAGLAETVVGFELRTFAHLAF
jgi:hypothetical protein